MILTEIINIDIKSPITIKKLKEIGISSEIGDNISLDIEKLWKTSTILIDVKCDICGHEKELAYRKYVKNIKNYNIYTCSTKCSSFKNKQTCLKKYGVDSPIKDRKIKDKSILTKITRYGDANYNNRDKYKQTCLDKYGVDNILKVEHIKKKVKDTCLEKYNNPLFRNNKKARVTKLFKYGNANYNNRDKYKQTCLDKYGVDSTNKLDSVKKKKIETQLEKYGFINNSISDICKMKLKQTNLNRYGVEYPMQVEEFAEKQFKKSLKMLKYKNRDIWYQGTYEHDFLAYCEENNIIDKIKRGKAISYIFENSNKVYYPDFYYEPLNLIIEIKSSYTYKKHLDKNLTKKHKCISDGYNFLFIIDKKYDVFNHLLT